MFIVGRFEELTPKVNETKLITDSLWKAYEVWIILYKNKLASLEATLVRNYDNTHLLRDE